MEVPSKEVPSMMLCYPSRCLGNHNHSDIPLSEKIWEEYKSLQGTTRRLNNNICHELPSPLEEIGRESTGSVMDDMQSLAIRLTNAISSFHMPRRIMLGHLPFFQHCLPCWSTSNLCMKSCPRNLTLHCDPSRTCLCIGAAWVSEVAARTRILLLEAAVGMKRPEQDVLRKECERNAMMAMAIALSRVLSPVEEACSKRECDVWTLLPTKDESCRLTIERIRLLDAAVERK